MPGPSSLVDLVSCCSEHALEETWSGVSSQEAAVYFPGATSVSRDPVTREVKPAYYFIKTVLSLTQL